MSRQSDGSHTYLARDGLYYSTYLELCQANKRHNEAHIRKLGLEKYRAPKTSRPLKRRKTETKSIAEVRRSSRVRNTPPEYTPIQDIEHVSGEIVTKRKTRKRPPKVDKTVLSSLTEEQRQLLASVPEWMEDMERYLLTTEQLSQPNFRSVMRQVERLVKGDGITYSRWPEGTYFYKNKPVDLTCDLDALYDEAVEFENEYGRDLGNGWLLRHPIKKLQNFQSYLYESQQPRETTSLKTSIAEISESTESDK